MKSYFLSYKYNANCEIPVTYPIVQLLDFRNEKNTYK